MPKLLARRLARCCLLGLCLLHAPAVLAGTATSLANFTAPLQTAIDWMTGDIGRLVSTLVLAAFGFHLWKKRADDKGERGLMFLVGTAVVLGAANIVGALGFVGATY